MIFPAHSDRRRSLLLAAVGFALVFGMLPIAALSDVEASETCVNDASAALKADSPRAFGPEAIIDGPKIIASVELELGAAPSSC
jgi:hypothetical protein